MLKINDHNPAKVLVTGATGFVGQELCRRLKTKGFDLVGVGRSARCLLSSGSNFYQRDLETDDINDLVSGDLSCIVHAAGQAHCKGGNSTQQLQSFWRANVEVSTRLARLAIETRVRRFVFVSSIGVHGSGTKDAPISEDSGFNPVSRYAASKLEAERSLISLFETSQHSELTIVRPTLVYGENAPGNFGRLLKLANSPLPLPFGQCVNRRNLISLSSLVDFLIACTHASGAADQCFDVADSSALSTADIVSSLRRGMDRSERLVSIPPRLISAGLRLIGKSEIYNQLFNDLEVDNKKAKTLVDWTPCHNSKLELEKIGRLYADFAARN